MDLILELLAMNSFLAVQSSTQTLFHDAIFSMNTSTVNDKTELILQSGCHIWEYSNY